MKYAAILIIALTLYHYTLSFGIFAATPLYATCDACGYCPIDLKTGLEQPPPQSWAKCVQCLYVNGETVINGTKVDPQDSPIQEKIRTELERDLQDGTADGANKVTLLVDDATRKPPQTIEGKFYTTLTGCIDLRSISGNQLKFEQVGAIGALSQTVFNVIFNIVKIVALLGLMWGGYTVSTASGNPVQLQKGRQILYASITGLLVGIFAVYILNFIINTLFKGVAGP